MLIRLDLWDFDAEEMREGNVKDFGLTEAKSCSLLIVGGGALCTCALSGA